MDLIRIKDFGRAGLNTDVQPTLIDPGAWTTLENIDIQSGDIRSAWGDTKIPDNAPVDPIYTFVHSIPEIDRTFIFASDGDALWVYEDYTVPGSPSWRDISSPDVDKMGGTVTFTVFLGRAIINFSLGVATSWTWNDATIIQLEGWLDTYHCSSIHAYRNFLFALGFYVDGDSISVRSRDYTVKWSDAAATGQLPAEWDATAENLAGSVQLRDTNGPLTTAEILRDDFVIYKTDSIYRCYYTSDEFVFGFERTINDRGCDSLQGVASISGVHIFSDHGDIRLYDGQSTRSLVIDRIKSLLQPAANNPESNSTIVTAWPERDEVYVTAFPAGQTFSDQVLVYSTDVDSWSVKNYPGIISMTLARRFWESEVLGNRVADSMMFGNTINELYLSDETDTDKDGLPKLCVAERTGMLVGDIDKSVTLRAVYPELLGDATVSISIGCAWQANDPNIRWSAPQSFTGGVDKRINVRMTGTPVAVRVTSEQDASWRLGALSFLVTPAGTR